jgi:uncharacterized protein YigA (DUF484 family)
LKILTDVVIQSSSMKTSLAITTALLFLLLCGISKPARAEITVLPEDLTIQGIRGEAVTRTLTFQSDSPIPKFDVIGLDITRVDGAATLSSTAISTETPQSSAQLPDNLKQVLVTLDLSKVQQSGEFKGVLLLRYTDRTKEIPLSLAVKDRLWRPLLVLVLGVALGVGLSVYRAEGRDRDQLVVQIGRIRTRMRADAELVNSFQTKIEANLAIADTQLDDKRWIDAATSIGNAQLLWQKWLQHRQDWITQIKYIQDLKEDAKKQSVPESVPYGRAIFAALTDLESHAAESEKPQQLRDTLVTIRQQVEQYGRGRACVEKLENMRKQLPDDKKEFWKERKSQLEQRLDELHPADTEAFKDDFKKWQADATAAIQELATAIEKHQTTASGNESVQMGTRDLQVMLLQQPGLVPAVSQGISSESHIARARWRLFAVNWLSRSIAIVMLSWAGLNQLYATKPTFGVDPFTDYFALLAWGVGAETTRSSVVKVIQDLGVPLPKQ